MVVCNKMDLVEEDEEVVYRVEKKARELGICGDVVGCSAMRGGGLEDVAEGVRRLCEESRGYQ